MIPNIVKGRGITGALAYCMSEGYEGEGLTKKQYFEARAAGIDPKGAKAELAEGEASRATILGGQNFGFAIDSPENLELARKVMEWIALPENQTSRGRKCEKDCFHASLSWEQGQQPTPDDMREAAQDFLKALGMETAHAVFIAHEDKAHPHVHIVASRIDPQTGRTLSEENDFAYAQAWALQYERQHGLTPQSEARQALHKMVDAVEARNGAAVADLLTERSPTFTARELDKALMLASITPDDRAKFRAEILHGGEVVGLRETEDAAVIALHDAEGLAGRNWLVARRRPARRRRRAWRRAAHRDGGGGEIYPHPRTGRGLGAAHRKKGLRHAVGRSRNGQEPHAESGSQRVRAGRLSGHRTRPHQQDRSADARRRFPRQHDHQ